MPHCWAAFPTQFTPISMCAICIKSCFMNTHIFIPSQTLLSIGQQHVSPGSLQNPLPLSIYLLSFHIHIYSRYLYYFLRNKLSHILSCLKSFKDSIHHPLQSCSKLYVLLTSCLYLSYPILVHFFCSQTYPLAAFESTLLPHET